MNNQTWVLLYLKQKQAQKWTPAPWLLRMKPNHETSTKTTSYQLFKTSIASASTILFTDFGKAQGTWIECIEWLNKSRPQNINCKNLLHVLLREIECWSRHKKMKMFSSLRLRLPCIILASLLRHRPLRHLWITDPWFADFYPWFCANMSYWTCACFCVCFFFVSWKQAQELFMDFVSKPINSEILTTKGFAVSLHKCNLWFVWLADKQ